MMGICRILLADDHKILRDGLRELLGREKDLVVVAEAGDGLEVLHLARDHAPDVVVMDVMMPGCDGIEATRRLREAGLSCRVVALSMYAEGHFVAEMFRAGASAFLRKDCAFRELADAVRSAYRGEVFLGTDLLRPMAEMFVHSVRGEVFREDEPALTPREREILGLLARGATNREVAERLHLSPKTVANHRQNIMHKLKLKNAVELTRFAIRTGIISCE